MAANARPWAAFNLSVFGPSYRRASFTDEKLEVEFHRQLTNAASVVAEDDPKIAGAVVKVSIHGVIAIELRMVEGIKEFRAEFCRK